VQALLEPRKLLPHTNDFGLWVKNHLKG
jgi:hypothetical protein